MRITPVKKFRIKHQKGALAQRGVSIDVDNEYGQTLVQTGLAVADTKALRDYENKMLAEYANKKLPVDTETAEQRSQGWVGPGKKAETPEERTQGYRKGKAPEKDDDEKPQNSPKLSQMPKKIQDDLGAYDAEQDIKDKDKERKQLEKEGLKTPAPDLNLDEAGQDLKEKDKERKELQKEGIKPPTQSVADQNVFKSAGTPQKPDDQKKK
jgi:hypothetical protein